VLPILVEIVEEPLVVEGLERSIRLAGLSIQVATLPIFDS
jgi:hypothetical protein